MDIDTRCEHLSESRWANEFTGPELFALAKYMSFTTVDRGQPILREGDREAYLCVLIRGRAAVVKEGHDKPETLAYIGAGSVLGEMSLFDGEPRSATVIASEDADLLVFTAHHLETLTHDKPLLAAKLLLKLGKVISQRLRVASGKLCEVSHLIKG
ncbi:MAG TPA: cyclic nucleotide-binding domain-containing protein [Methylococcaceae bacterium]|nr:cyclic nucleotide-binding domain-containing protein [Methylococcaceae bacterium]